MCTVVLECWKNFIRTKFAANSFITGGSEDGFVYIWDVDTGDLIQRLKGHQGVVYDVAWNQNQSLLISCSDDHNILAWNYKDSENKNHS